MVQSNRNLVFILLLGIQGGILMLLFNWFAVFCPNTSKPSNGKIHVLLLSSWRSGSTVAGQAFNQHPDVFYLMEPGYHVWASLRQAKSRTLRMALRDELRSLFHCDFSVMDSYLPDDAKVSSLHMWLNSRALCSRPGCPPIPPNQSKTQTLCMRLCDQAPMSHVEKICRNHSHVVLKEVRIFELASLYPLFKDPDLDLRIVHLVRDPRAVELSRQKTFGNSILENQEYTALEAVCRSHVRISETALRSPPPFLKGRYKMIRYEDVVRNPLGEITSMYKFVGLKMTEQLAQWIQQLKPGNEDVGGNFTTDSRDAVKVSQAWRTNMDYTKVQRVQRVCGEAMSLLGYKLANSEDELLDLDRNLLLSPELTIPEEENQ